MNFRQHRLNAGLTQQDLADSVGVTERTIRNLEAGRAVSWLTVQAVLRALHLEIVPARFALWANTELDKQHIGFPAKAEINQTWEGLRR